MPENAAVDLWPEDLAIAPLRTPLDVLREQGEFLENRTGGRLEVRVVTSSHSGHYIGDERSRFRHRMLVVVPALENYEYELLSLYQAFHFYPVQGVLGDESLLDRTDLHSEVELRDWLRNCFQNPKIKETINTLFTMAART